MIAFIPALTLLASVLSSASAAPLKPVVDEASVAKFERCLPCEAGAVDGLKGDPKSLLATGTGLNTDSTVGAVVGAAVGNGGDDNGDGNRKGSAQRHGSPNRNNAKVPAMDVALGMQGNLTRVLDGFDVTGLRSGKADLAAFLSKFNTDVVIPGIAAYAKLDANSYAGVNKDDLAKLLIAFPAEVYVTASTYPSSTLVAASNAASDLYASIVKLIKSVNGNVKDLAASLNSAIDADVAANANVGTSAETNTGDVSDPTQGIDSTGAAALRQLVSTSCSN